MHRSEPEDDSSLRVAAMPPGRPGADTRPAGGSRRADYDRISREHFERSYAPPPDLRFATSDALFPPTKLRTVFADEFEQQYLALCFGPFPTWGEVQDRLEAIRELL